MMSRGKLLVQASLRELPRRQKASPIFWIDAGVDPDGFMKRYISNVKGYGVFSEYKFEKGDFLLEYCGELLVSKQEISRRTLRHEIQSKRCVKRGHIPRFYMFHFKHNGKKCCIDATYAKERKGHYINDAKEGVTSCNARMKMISYKNRPRLLLFASRDIEVGEEICFDYGDDNNLWWRREGEERDQELGEKTQQLTNDDSKDGPSVFSRSNIESSVNQNQSTPELVEENQLVDEDQLVNPSDSEDSDCSIQYPYLDKLSVNVCEADSTSRSKDFEVQSVSTERRGLHDYSKKHACLYCGKLDFKITRHLCTWHKNEKEIALLPPLSKNKPSIERERILDRIRNQGDFLYNINQLKSGKGSLIIARRPKQGIHTAADYLPCQYCLRFFIKGELWRHCKTCKLASDSHDNHERNEVKTSRTILQGAGVVNKEENTEFYQNVIETMKCDDIGKVVKQDYSIMKVGQVLYGRLGKKRAAEVRYRIRLLGRLKCKLIPDSLDQKQIQLITYIKPDKFNDFVYSVKQLVRVSDEKSLNGVIMFDKPETAKKAGQLVKRLAELKQGQAIKERNSCDRQDAIDFLTLYSTEWKDSIGSIACQTARERNYNKKDMLPLTEDLIKLRKFCDKMIIQHSDLLKASTNIQNWRALANIALCKVQLFNFRRGNECSRMLREKYQARANWRQCNQEIFNSLDKVECELAKRMDLVEIMGKKDRKVPVLLTPSVRDALDLLNSMRNTCQIPDSNPYVFAKGCDSYIRGSEALNIVLDKVPGLQNPEYIRFPKMRKYLATVVQIYGLSEIELQEVARHLGHELTVHRQYYRLQDDVIELAKISKLLLAVESGKAHRFAGKSLEEIDIEGISDFEENGAEREQEEEMEIDQNQEHSPSVKNLKTVEVHAHHLRQQVNVGLQYQFDQEEDMDDTVKDPTYTEEISDSASDSDENLCCNTSKRKKIGWKQCGSIEVAQTRDRMIYCKRKAAMAQAVGEEVHVMLPKDVKDRCPWIKYTDLQGALWWPNDGVVTAPDLTMRYAKKASQMGVKIIEKVGVEKVLTENDTVCGVQTTHGEIRCEHFVNCTGQWARELGKKCSPKVRVPVHPCEHFYIVTQPIEGMDPLLPVIRDADGSIYIREWNGGIMAGGFEPPSHGGKPVFHTGIPDKFEFQLLPEDWDQFQILLDGILNRMPLLNDAQIRLLTNGPESFTPDKNWILGESAEVFNYYVAAGMHSRGIQGSGGVGKYISELIVDGKGSIANLWVQDIQRFVPHHSNRKFLRERVKESIGLYHLQYPTENFQSGRNLRTSPIHTQLKVLGAKFGETNAYERAMYFTPGDQEDLGEYTDEKTLTKGTFGKPGWFNAVKLEYQACKERVCLVDMSSFTKMEIKSKGPEALEFLQYMCSNNMDQEIGTVIHTGMLNPQGGYENDCSIVPLRDNTFFLIAPTTQQTRCMYWLQKHLPKDGSVQVRDVTSMYSGINMVGPHAQQLLNDVTETSTSKTDFKPMTCQVIDVGNASNIITMRLTHCGEDGFILYIPSEYALHVYEMLMKMGKDYGVRNCGYLTLRHLRIEKLFAYWGTDMDPQTTPFETGREFRVDLQKKDFIGKEALINQKTNGISKKFCQLLLQDFDLDTAVWPMGNEPIYRNGKYVGMTTSSGYGFTLDKFVCLGYINHMDDKGQPVVTRNILEYIKDPSATYEIDVAGTRYPVTVGVYTPKKAYKASDRPTFIPVPGN